MKRPAHHKVEQARNGRTPADAAVAEPPLLTEPVLTEPLLTEVKSAEVKSAGEPGADPAAVESGDARATDSPGTEAPAGHQETSGAQPAGVRGADAAADNGGGARPEVAPNYQYWREFGAEWAKEYNLRKLTVPLYHIQEIMLTEYLGHHAPAKVLEFGCGPGRHLRNLAQIPGIEARGYDQSAAMVSGCLTWTNQAWIDRHITVGLPTGRLPFKDGEFDIVYSAEVLVHVRPEDLPGVLSELLRIAKRQVFHLEPDEHIDIVSDDHSGCWKPDLVAAYAKLGKKCELLPSGYKAHAPYRVILDEKAPKWQWPPLLISLYRRMEGDLAKGFAEMRAAAEVAQQQVTALERGQGAADGRIATVAGQIADRSAESERLRAKVTELTEALAKQRAIAREQAAELLGQIEAERARSSQALSAQWHTLHRLKKLFPEKGKGQG